jgi:SMI1 / KNR4 family (SUKH-1)
VCFLANALKSSSTAIPSSRKEELMDTIFTGLFERIREKCRRDGWYGGALDLQHARSDHPQRHGFAYPPASEEQLRATETALRFLLPPVLRVLYAEVANGGFGPGGGIQGVLGGYGSRADELARTIVDDYHWHCQVGYTEIEHHGPAQLIDLSSAAKQGKYGSGKEDLLLPHRVWPEQLLSLEDLGCCMKACLDCKTGRVLCVAPSGNDEEYEIGPIAPSLEDYLERWLRDEVVP